MRRAVIRMWRAHRARRPPTWLWSPSKGARRLSSWTGRNRITKPEVKWKQRNVGPCWTDMNGIDATRRDDNSQCVFKAYFSPQSMKLYRRLKDQMERRFLFWPQTRRTRQWRTSNQKAGMQLKTGGFLSSVHFPTTPQERDNPAVPLHCSDTPAAGWTLMTLPKLQKIHHTLWMNIDFQTFVILQQRSHKCPTLSVPLTSSTSFPFPTPLSPVVNSLGPNSASPCTNAWLVERCLPTTLSILIFLKSSRG